MNVWRNRRRAFLFVVGWLVIAVWTAVPFAFAEEPAGEAPGARNTTPKRAAPGAGITTPAEEATRAVITTPAGETAGAGRITREQEKPVAHLCAGCLAPIFTDGSKGSITPYGRIELDAIYSNRMTNPLDPGQFNGYATAAGTSSNSSTTLNPRYSVFGLRAERTDGVHTLAGVVEIDFYGQTDNAGNLPPRLRLANARYTTGRTSLTVGQDWTPVMALHPDLIDFSIMGYNGNLWQRLPQITLRHDFTENLQGLVTVMRFERGLTQCCGQTQVRPITPPANGAIGGNQATINAFNDPDQNPYYGSRLAWSGSGTAQGMVAAVNAAYRYYRSAPAPGNPLFQSGRDINSYVVGGELVVPLRDNLKFSGEIAYGQALGVEWFRFNQELNLVNGNPIRSFVGWAQLSWAASKDFTFLGGYGWDNPLNSDLKGSQAINIPGSNIQYLLNHRTYATVIHPIWADFYTGFEWNHLMTEWASGQHNQGDNYMLSFWYNF